MTVGHGSRVVTIILASYDTTCLPYTQLEANRNVVQAAATRAIKLKQN